MVSGKWTYIALEDGKMDYESGYVYELMEQGDFTLKKENENWVLTSSRASKY